MRVFRRNSAGAPGSTADDSRGAPGGRPPGEESSTQSQDAPAKTKPPAQAGKGRPTPKRSEAERNRYQSITGSSTSGRGPAGSGPKGKLTPEEKARVQADRAKRTAAMRRGEEWALGPRDRGPIKKLARDYVDSRRRPSEFYMYVLVLLLIALLSRDKALNTYVSPLVIVLIVVVAIDAFFLRRSLHRLAAERYPSESTRGMTTYGVMRALQIRRFRMPAPRLKPGDQDKV
jgi:Protein of unknown function (DUF3043)